MSARRCPSVRSVAEIGSLFIKGFAPTEHEFCHYASSFLWYLKFDAIV
jgi:hypothetical protein